MSTAVYLFKIKENERVFFVAECVRLNLIVNDTLESIACRLRQPIQMLEKEIDVDFSFQPKSEMILFNGKIKKRIPLDDNEQEQFISLFNAEC